MSEQALGRWLIDGVLAVLLLELIARTLWRERALGWHRGAVWSLLSGGALVLALRAAWRGQGLAAVALWLTLAGLCHLGQCLAPRP